MQATRKLTKKMTKNGMTAVGFLGRAMFGRPPATHVSEMAKIHRKPQPQFAMGEDAAQMHLVSDDKAVAVVSAVVARGYELAG